MSSSMYLEHYLDSLSGIESLPHDLQRNFTLMRDLDQRSQDLLKEIDKMAEEYISNVRSMEPEKRTQHLKKIENAFNKSKELNDDKVQLAMQTYEMVDKHIRKLDADLSRFEADLKEQRAQELGQVEEEVVESNPKSKKGRGRGRGRKSESEPASKRRKEESSPRGLQGLTPLLGGEVQVLDMPVDPNEPTYCVCHQVSYGEMIGCDNPECPIEWFHFGCVGLSSKPKGKWFCSKCALDRKKK